MINSKCPICKKPTITDFSPFCSKRCKDIDLAHWLRGDYHIPGEEKKDEEKSKNDEEED
jgi:endogenous inhibitor of DNA gyrase (YacG/DUF329 family)